MFIELKVILQYNYIELIRTKKMSDMDIASQNHSKKRFTINWLNLNREGKKF